MPRCKAIVFVTAVAALATVCEGKRFAKKDASQQISELGQNELADTRQLRWGPPEPTLPPSPLLVDLRNHPCIPPVRNRGKCSNGDWAFAVIDAIEFSQCYLYGGVSPVSLSVQQLLDCDTTDSGCKSGTITNALTFLGKAPGIYTAASYPFTSDSSGAAGTCKSTSGVVGAKLDPKTPFGTLADKFGKIYNPMMNAISRGIPVVATIDVGPSLFKYTTGPYEAYDCYSNNQGKMAVSIVGYKNDAYPYLWVAKFSNGTAWGQRGYVYIRMGINVCHLESNPVLVPYVVGPTPPPQPTPAPTTPTPTKSVDYRTHKCLQPVKNQGSCVSGDWAFAATAAAEFAQCILTDKPLVLSEQQLLDCDYSDTGCARGNATVALSYISRIGGIQTAASYPYTSGGSGVAGTCKFCSATVGAVANLPNRITDVAAMRAALDNRQLLTATMNLVASFMTYTSGIYYEELCYIYILRQQSLTIVGYYMDSTIGYWIARNSWGTAWGQAGYAYIQMGVDTCKIESNGMYPANVVANQPTTTAKTPTTTPPPLPPVDYRNHSCMQPIKNQGKCQSGDWAFAAVAAVEFAQCILTGNRLALSEQQLLDCDYRDNGCAGGDPFVGVDYLSRSFGSVTAASYPYTSGSSGVAGTCRFCPTTVGAKVPAANATIAITDIAAMRAALDKRQLLVARMNITNSFIEYTTGIYDQPICDRNVLGIQYLTIVGYRMDTLVPYWIARNSWGTAWGQAGYALIQMGFNICNIEGNGMLATTVVASTPEVSTTTVKTTTKVG